jgi:polysaccharide biosynthesis protein PslH
MFKRILHVSQLPASPPRFGAQVRIHGLLSEIASRSEVTALSLVDPEFDLEECRRAMLAYCREVVLVPNPQGAQGWRKRVLQLRSMASTESFERLRVNLPAFARVLGDLLARRNFDLVYMEFAHLARYLSAGRPPLVIDAHAIDHDVVRQSAGWDVGLMRYVYGSVDWRKVRREEVRAFRSADGICACSVEDQRRILTSVPGARTFVVPNAADIDFYQGRSGDPSPDGRTILFFGLLSTFPNVDAVCYFLDRIWPLICSQRPNARFKIVGADPPAKIVARAGTAIEIAGFVEDLRPHIASAAALVVPLRFGGGTRLKIIEGMAMQKAVVSTRLGAEGIEVVSGSHIIIEDDPKAFADAVIGLLDNPAQAAQIGAAARQLVEQRYSWHAAAKSLENFFDEVIAARAQGHQDSTRQVGCTR